MLDTLTTQLKAAQAVVFVNFSKLKVKEIEELRRKCREEQVDYVVAKKTLMKLAVKEAGYTGIDEGAFDKEAALVMSKNDVVAPARIVQAYAKEHADLHAFGGVLEGAFVDRNKVIELSKLPSKQELLGKLLGSLNAPLSGLVGVLSGTPRKLVYALNAIKETK